MTSTIPSRKNKQGSTRPCLKFMAVNSFVRWFNHVAPASFRPYKFCNSFNLYFYFHGEDAVASCLKPSASHMNFSGGSIFPPHALIDNYQFLAASTSTFLIQIHDQLNNISNSSSWKNSMDSLPLFCKLDIQQASKAEKKVNRTSSFQYAMAKCVNQNQLVSR